jgi:hypothetical protein
MDNEKEMIKGGMQTEVGKCLVLVEVGVFRGEMQWHEERC